MGRLIDRAKPLRKLLPALLLGWIGLAGPAAGQVAETFEIGLSTETIAISSDFDGATLVVFGALDDADPMLLRQGRYDIVVALEGPERPVVVRRKDRVLGLWINREAEAFEHAPASYSLASTRRLSDVAPDPVLEQLGVGVGNLRLGFERDPDEAGEDREEFAQALLRIRTENGLYRQTFGTVEFISPTLFRASLILPADLPVGRHVARAYLFRSGVFMRQDAEPLWVVKVGLESYLHDFAIRNGFFYGLFAVFLAIFTGWLGRVIFKRD